MNSLNSTLPPLSTMPRSTLSSDQVEMIEEALRCAGDYGEVRLVIEKGRLRFVIVERSFDALKWRPGNIAPER